MLKISQVRTATNDEWDSLWLNCSYSTYFHSREWAEIWREYSRHAIQPDPRLVIFNDSQEALLPLSYQVALKGLFKFYLFSPAGTYGGWISCGHLKKEHDVFLAGYLTQNIKNLSWRINPFQPNIGDLELLVDKEEKTQALNLESGYKSLWLRWKKRKESLIRNIQKARKEGIEIRTASALEEWRQYYDIYQDSLRRWGKRASSQYEWDLFQILYQKKSPHIKLWIADYQERIVAGVLCFYAKSHVAYWHGAALEAFFKLRPVNLLIAEAVKHACDERYTWFDFNPSGGHEGVWKFKKSYSPLELESPMVLRSSLCYRLYSKSLKIRRKISSLR